MGMRYRSVLAYVPDAKTLEFAAGLARNSSLAAVEGTNLFPLRGWAAQVNAVDLTRPKDEADGLDARLASLLVRFLRTGGPAMLRMMGGSPCHAEHEHGGDRMYNGHHH
ncbi:MULTISPECIES: hypothetical protein [unclassified Streptomyces]|uniref:hypothetical protein n=1 Tax=unclassified Streptomyces TaxID=2593676 RepID=UPI0022539A4E|nr:MULTISPECIES: hypothetical protein [unclassified Streptomyces]MCX4407042.1 hypothetical protein [Streptomyces sp. NBC_01764]MCX5188270.1 hypothetical protein [Streptomyces sp. NBC_00268]